ncbi:hypothetical protein SUDANB120_06644 (plasmid) [Streptomyces sp. enrichment culture]|uniref:DUF1206 domain-containing protein n=1 Tax=Streptomyces TaxID=1883 RepID=UPI001674D968|nr:MULTISPECIES: DUF1206 domain-containing protein [Streptomyces]MBD3575242.1 DUF1206 domain-containing protein [Streptomyces sp. KD18]GGS91689.1 membrane protein [Streptomyces toxytricini]
MNTRTLSFPWRAKARGAANSSAVGIAARWGFAARGVLYVLVGLIALRIAFGDSGGEADRGGALAVLSAQPLGSVLLWALGAGLAGMAVWRLSEALFGAAGEGGHKAGKRLASAARCVFYAFVAYSVLMFAAGESGSGSGSGDQQSKDVTARALDLTGGRWLVGLAGAGIVVAGVWIAGRAALRKYHKHLKLGAMSRKERRFTDVTGVVGGVARGAVFAVAGVFVTRAALTYEPNEAKGLDDALRSFAETPTGPWLLALVAAGLAFFGLFSFAMARWRRV